MDEFLFVKCVILGYELFLYFVDYEFFFRMLFKVLRIVC